MARNVNADIGMGGRVAEAIMAANNSFVDTLLLTSLTRDQMGGYLMSISPEVMAVLGHRRKTDIAPIVDGGHWALFKPRFSNLSDLRSLNRSDFNEDDMTRLMEKTLPLAAPTRVLSPAVVQGIEATNRLVFEAYETCAAEGDPVAPILLGVSADYLAEFMHARKSKLLTAFSKKQYPLFCLRHDRADLMTSICTTGFRSAEVIRELTKDFCSPGA